MKILIDIADDSQNESIMAIKQAKAMIAFYSMRRNTVYMTDEEIEAEISAVH